MSQPKLVLLADNDADFLKSFAEVLEGTGRYKVVRVDSPDGVRAKIRNPEGIVAALLDIRLRDDGDVNDISGLELTNIIPSNMPCLFLSNNNQDVIDRYIRANIGKVVRFVGKTSDPQVRIDAVDALFKLVVMHISDLQFGQCPGDIPRGSNSLTSAQREWIRLIANDVEALHIRPNVLVISGDITEQGLPEQFSVAKTFINALASTLFIPAIVVTPGNHDICWFDSRAAYMKLASRLQGALPSYASVEGDPVLQADIINMHESEHDLLFQRFYEYQQFLSELYAGKPEQAFNRTKQYTVHAFNDSFIVSLNSCRRECHLSSCHYGYIDPEQLLSAVREMDAADPHRVKLRLAVCHHHLGLNGGGAEPNGALQNANALLHIFSGSGIEILLHGHLHQTIAFQVAPLGGGSRLVQIATGSLYLPTMRSANLGNQYEILEINEEADQKSRLYLRRYNVAAGRWTPDDTYDTPSTISPGVISFVLNPKPNE